MRSRFLAAIALAIAVVSPTFAQGTKDDFFFKKGDVVLVDGDSITEQRLYTTYIEAYTLARYPAWKLYFRNVG